MDTEKAAIGVLITMHHTTKQMRIAAAKAGFYESTWGQKKHPRAQILTIEELLDGRTIDAPPMSKVVTFKKSPKAEKGKTAHQPEMDFDGTDADDVD